MDQSPDQSLRHKIDSLRYLTSGLLSTSVSKLSGSSRVIPSDKDFHFFNNFDEFKVPINEIAQKSESILESIGSSSHLWGKEMSFPKDLDDAYDWLVNVNDEVFERFDVSVDELQKSKTMEKEDGKVSLADSDDGFKLVYGKKKKKAVKEWSEGKNSGNLPAFNVASMDKKATGTKAKVPFHIPTIPRPQDEFKILVNNSNQPFEHVWLQRSLEGSRFIHPLENASVLDFVDKNIEEIDPIKPPPIENTPFKLVEDVQGLKALAAKLHDVNEFAVDLEHNQYRSFQGMTCLMQISTRSEDYVIDTLKLRVHIGPYLREVFKDPKKKKVMHGADRDILWLQRDFGIYICNLFDTGQGSKVLGLERNSLEYLLQHFCGVTANKEYQNADWRLRPLPDEMLRYAREDTHYLLHIYDLMKIRLLTFSSVSENSDSHLVEVYKRSSAICMNLYEKELLTDNSYLYIYGLQGTNFNTQQLAIVAGLCQWRDVVARMEDESTGYILPNKTLLEIAKEMPVTAGKLRRLVRSRHAYIERNLGSVVNIIKTSIQNAPAFEGVVQQLKEGLMGMASKENDVVAADVSETFPRPAPKTMAFEEVSTKREICGSMSQQLSASVVVKEETSEPVSTSEELGENGKANKGFNSNNSSLPTETPSGARQIGESNGTDTGISNSAKVTEATIQVLKKPTRSFGALLGNSATKRKHDCNKREIEDIKLEQIKASVSLPFQPFVGREEPTKPVGIEKEQNQEPLSVTTSDTHRDDIILLEGNSNAEGEGSIKSDSSGGGSDLETDNKGGGDEPISLSELSSSFHECFQTKNRQNKNSSQKKSQLESGGGSFKLKPFDYEAARKKVEFGEVGGGQRDDVHRGLFGSSSGRKSSSGKVERVEETNEFQQGRRRQAFPLTGNRSATFR